jgi:hypothetical protein
MRTSLKRLAHLRAGLHEQAQGRLKVAEQCLSAAESAKARLERVVAEQVTAGDVAVAFLELNDTAARITDEVVDMLARQRTVLAEEHCRRATEHRQVDKLVERAAREARREEERRVQRETDDWAQARWRRR